MALALLADWDNFYVIAGGAAGGLTGLTFVVIALATDSQRVDVADVLGLAFRDRPRHSLKPVPGLAEYLIAGSSSIKSRYLGYKNNRIASARIWL